MNELLSAMTPRTLTAMITDAIEAGLQSPFIYRMIEELISHVGPSEAINMLCDADVPETYWPELEPEA